MSKKLIVAVDGPAGSGKSSTFRLVAKHLGYNFIDTGLMYRAFTLLGVQKKVDFNDPQALVHLIPHFRYHATPEKIYLNHQDVTTHLSDSGILTNINKVTAIPQIREAMVTLQRNLAFDSVSKGLIMVGRDIASVVLPHAHLKIYLDSSIERRARRRLEQNHQSSYHLEELKKQIKKRDQEDQNRAVGPLKKTEDAWYLDNSNLSLEETAALVVKKIHQLEQ